MDLFSLVATLGLDTSGFTSGIGAAKGIFGDFTSAITSGLKMAGDATVDFMKDVVQTGMGFDKQMSAVQAVLGREEGTVENMTRLREFALDQAKDSIFTAEETAQAYYYMGMAGWKAEEMLDGLPGVLALAAASGEDLARTSDIVTDYITAFGLKAEDVSEFVDVLAKTATDSNTDVYKMGETFKYVASLAGAAGQDYKDFAVAIGLMANRGTKGSQAGTSLRSIMSRLATDTGNARTTLEKLGVQVFDTSGNMRDFGDITNEARAAWKGLNDEQSLSYAKSIGGQYGMTGWLNIMNATQEEADELAKSFDNATGAAEDMANTRLDNLWGDLQRFNSSLNVLKQSIFDDVKGPLRDVVQFATKALDRIKAAVDRWGLEGGFKQLAVEIENAGTYLEPIFTSLGQAAAPLVDTLINTIMPRLGEAGAKIAGGLLQGFGDTLAGSTNTNSSLIGTILGGVGYSLNIVETIANWFKEGGSQGAAAAREELAASFDPTNPEYTPPDIFAWLNTGGDPTMIPDSITSALNDASDGIATAATDKIDDKGLATGKVLGAEIQRGLNSRSYSVNVKANVQYPSTTVRRHASATNVGHILNGAQVFGIDSAGVPQIGGDAGQEAVVGTSALQRMIREAVRAGNGRGANYTINIYQQPGQSEQELVRTIQRLLIQAEREGGVAAR